MSSPIPYEVIYNLLYCRRCKGKGTIYNPKGRDKPCECRKQAKRWLKDNE